MTQEEKELLLKDLCARLPYGIYANLPNHHLVSHKYIIHDINIQNGWTTGRLYCAGRIQIYGAKVEDVKPYLRPMSSMTEEEKKEYNSIQCDFGIVRVDRVDEIFEFLLSHHFDFVRTNDGLTMIEAGLALEAPKGMYNIKEK